MLGLGLESIWALRRLPAGTRALNRVRQAGVGGKGPNGRRLGVVRNLPREQKIVGKKGLGLESA